MPVFALGNATVEGLRRLLDALGALPAGGTHVVVTDLREELVLYVNGTAYLRRWVGVVGVSERRCVGGVS